MGTKLYVSNDGKNFTEVAALVGDNLSTIPAMFIYKAIGFYLKTYSTKKSKCTRVNERTYFSELYQFLISNSIYEVNKVTHDLMFAYQSMLLTKVGPSTVNRQFNTFKNFFSLLHKNEQISKDPCARIEALKCDNPVIQLWTARDLIKVYQDNAGLKSILKFMWFSGGRSCEVVNLMATDINWDDMTITFRSLKNGGNNRQVVITKKIEKVLHKMPMNGIYVFNYKGKRHTSDSLGKLIKKSVRKVCKNKNLTAKSIRHTYCTRAIEKGLNNKTVQELMGHSSWRTTEKYSHISKKHLKSAAERV